MTSGTFETASSHNRRQHVYGAPSEDAHLHECTQHGQSSALISLVRFFLLSSLFKEGDS